jgi:hypothetical protein
MINVEMLKSGTLHIACLILWNSAANVMAG